MATPLEIRVAQKQHLTSLLEIKKANHGNIVPGLDEAIKRVVGTMEQEDVAILEKVHGVKAI